MSRLRVGTAAKSKKASSKPTQKRTMNKKCGPKNVNCAATSTGTASSKPQYRSTLNPMREAFDLIRGYIGKTHKDLFLETPFSHLFEAFNNNAIHLGWKKNKPLDALLQTYSPTERGFKIGQQYYFPTKRDVQLIFGIVDGHKQVRDLSNYSLKETSLKTRLFYTDGRPNAAGVKGLLAVCARKKDPESCRDTIRLLCLLLFGCVFFANLGQNIALAYLWFVDDFERLCSYDWSSYILKEMQLGLDKECSTPGPFNPRNVNGCTVFFWYWLCERASSLLSICRIQEAGDVQEHNTLSKSAIPRLKKWNLKKLFGLVTQSSLQNMTDSEFCKEELFPTVNESFHIPTLRLTAGSHDLSDAEDSPSDCDSADDELELPLELLNDDKVPDEVCVPMDSSAPTAAGSSVAQSVSGSLEPPLVVVSQDLDSQNEVGVCGVDNDSSGSEEFVDSYIVKARSPVVRQPVENIMDVITDLPLCDFLTPSPIRPAVGNVAQIRKLSQAGVKQVVSGVARVLEGRRKIDGDIPSFNLCISPPPSPEDEGTVIDRLTAENLTMSNSLNHANKALAINISTRSSLVLMTNKANAFESENVKLSALIVDLKSKCGDLESKVLMLQQDANESNDLLLLKHTETEELKRDLKNLNAEVVHAKRTIVEQNEKITTLLLERAAGLSLLDNLKKQLERANVLLHEKDGKLGELDLHVLEKVASIEVLNEASALQRDKISFLEQNINDLEVSLSLLAPDCFVDHVENGLGASDTVVPVTPLTSSIPKKIVSADLEIIPQTIERGVKQFPRKRVKVMEDCYYFSEQKKKSKISKQEQEHDKQENENQLDGKKNPYFIPIENPVDQSNKLIIHEDRFCYPCGEFILPDVYTMLRTLNQQQGKVAEVWRSSADFLSFVNLDSVMSILNDLYIDAPVLDGVVEILKQDGLLKDSIFIFTSVLSNTVIECVRSGIFVHELFVQLLAALRDRKMVLFSYCCSGKESRPYHWVVLSYRLGDTHWKLYHSAPVQRGCTDMFVTECQLMLVHVLKGIESSCDGFVREKASILTNVVRFSRIPLQDTANNCCLYAAFFLYKLAQDMSIPRVLEDVEVQTWKATVVNALCLNTFHAVD